MLAVQENVAGLPHAFEFQKDPVAGISGRQLEMFAVPGKPFVRAAIAAAVVDDDAERVDIIKRVRRADRLPLRVVERRDLGPGNVLADEPPVGVEVVGHARRRGRRELRIRRPERKSGGEKGERNEGQKGF